MTKIALGLALISFSFCEAQNWKQEKIKESGHQITSNRTTAEYDQIAVSGSFQVNLVSGKEGAISITGDENIISHIVTEVENNELKIYFEKKKNYYYKSKITIEVPFESINTIHFTGSGDITTKNTIIADKFDVHLTGSGDVTLDLKATKTTASVAGSGDIILNGTSTILKASVAGSGDLDCSNLVAVNATADVAGSGDIKVNCTQKLIAGVAGSGSVKYKGKPETIEKSIAGSGDVEEY
jgi:uncharacterized protein YqkB